MLSHLRRAVVAVEGVVAVVELVAVGTK